MMAEYDVRQAQLSLSQLQREHALSLSQMRAELENLQARLTDTQLTAPFSGRVTYVGFQEGQKVEAYSVCIILSDESRILIQSPSYSNQVLSDAARTEFIINGKTYPVEYQAYDQHEYMERMLNSEELPSLFALKDDPDGSASGVSFGDTGTIVVYTIYHENAVAVPISCVESDSMGTYVYTDKDGERSKQYIRIGIKTTSWYEVLEGLTEGDTVYEQE